MCAMVSTYLRPYAQWCMCTCRSLDMYAIKRVLVCLCMCDKSVRSSIQARRQIHAAVSLPQPHAAHWTCMQLNGAPLEETSSPPTALLRRSFQGDTLFFNI